MDEHIQEVIQLFDGTRATFLESIKSIVDENAKFNNRLGNI